MVEAPEGTRDHAVAWANSARTARQRCRQYLREGSTTLTEVLDVGHRDELIGRLTLSWVLESLPEAGKVATRRKLVRLGIDGDTRVSEVDEATSRVLLEQFAARPVDDVPAGPRGADGSEVDDGL